MAHLGSPNRYVLHCVNYLCKTGLLFKDDLENGPFVKPNQMQLRCLADQPIYSPFENFRKFIVFFNLLSLFQKSRLELVCKQKLIVELCEFDVQTTNEVGVLHERKSISVGLSGSNKTTALPSPKISSRLLTFSRLHYVSLLISKDQQRIHRKKPTTYLVL